MASISDVAEISSCDLEMGESDSIPNGTAVADNQNTISLTFPNDTIMCPICMEGLKDPIFKLTCGHEFCKKCVSDYVVSSVSSGNSDFGCVYMNGGPGAYKMCAAKFDDETMADLLKHDAKMDKKYLRFKFLRDKKNGRECPKCEHLQLGSETSNAIICDICGNNYCYIHGGAHSGKTCEQYEDDIADETKATNDLLTQNSKSCPGCGIYVSKTAGCNHMKCSQCKTAFCWLCGKKISDDVFPNHFQWWNPTGCVNMQMNEEITPSLATLRIGRFWACLQICATGLCTVLSAMLTFCLCGICCVQRGKDRAETWRNSKNTCGQHMTVWGGIWLFILVISPAAIVAGVLYLVLAIVAVLLNIVGFLVQKAKSVIKRVVLGQTDEVSVQDNRINLFGPIRFTYQPPPQQSNISSSVSTVSHRKSASCTASTTIALETSTTDLEENVEGDVEKQPKCKLFTASNKAAGGVTDDFDKSKIVLSADQMIGLDMIELKDRTSFITDSIQDDLTNDVQTIVEDLIHDEEEIIV